MLCIFVLTGMVCSPKSLMCSPFAATRFFGAVLRSSLKRGNIPSGMTCPAAPESKETESEFHPSVLHLNDFLGARILTVLRTQQGSMIGFLRLLFVSSADHLLPLLIFAFFQQTPRLQLFIIVTCFFNDFALVFTNGWRRFSASDCVRNPSRCFVKRSAVLFLMSTRLRKDVFLVPTVVLPSIVFQCV